MGISEQESETVEFKKSTAQIERALKTVCAFLNHKGGAIYFGVSDKGKILGQDVSDSTLKSISQKIRHKIRPEISPEVNVLDIDEHMVIEVKIKEGRNKPYYLGGIAYKRTGSESTTIVPEELERIILDKKKKQWDSEICEGAVLDDIDEKKVRWFLRKAKYERNFDVNLEIPLQEVLEKLNIIIDGQLTNAAILFFGKKPQRFFLQAETKGAKFKGDKAVKPFLDMKVMEGTICEQVDEIEKFIMSNIKKAAWIEPGKIERQEKWEYPMDAIREAIINAICHRNYEETGNVQVRIFDGRLEVWNPGNLPIGWTVDVLKKKHESKPHNLLIARLFFLIKYIEEWGTGTTDMVNDTIKHGLPEPLFEDTGTSIIVTFRKYNISEEAMEKMPENERRIVEYIIEKGRISRKNCIELLNVSHATAFRYFEILENKKIIKRAGTGKNVHYLLA